MAAVAAPRLLILETSGRVGQVAVAEGPALLACRRLDEARRHARDLAPAVADLLAAQGWKPRDVHAVVVSRGPGSYTGLRVGVMSAKAFAFATGCGLIAVDTFDALAAQAPATAASVDVIADAQQDKVYVQRFARAPAGTDLRPAGPLAIRPLGEWLGLLGPAVSVTGPGLRTYGRYLPDGVHLVDSTEWDPHAETLLRLALARWQAGALDDLWAVEPLYLRPSAAEEKWHGR